MMMVVTTSQKTKSNNKWKHAHKVTHETWKQECNENRKREREPANICCKIPLKWQYILFATIESL